MALLLHQSPGLSLLQLATEDLPKAQKVFEQTPSYHLSVMGRPAPGDIAERCLEAQAPPPFSGGRTFKYMIGVARTPDDPSFVGVIDLFVGTPRFDIATIATFLISENLQRQHFGSQAMHALQAWLRGAHPVLRWLDLTVIDDNIAALRFLRTLQFERADYPQQIEINGKQRTMVRFELELTQP